MNTLEITATTVTLSNTHRGVFSTRRDDFDALKGLRTPALRTMILDTMDGYPEMLEDYAVLLERFGHNEIAAIAAGIYRPLDGNPEEWANHEPKAGPVVGGTPRELSHHPNGTSGASVRPEEHDTAGYDLAIEVRRSDGGAYSIPWTAEKAGVEDWHECLTALAPERVEDYGPLTGWGDWERVVRIVGMDGIVRWFFLRCVTRPDALDAITDAIDAITDALIGLDTLPDLNAVLEAARIAHGHAVAERAACAGGHR